MSKDEKVKSTERGCRSCGNVNTHTDRCDFNAGVGDIASPVLDSERQATQSILVCPRCGRGDAPAECADHCDHDEAFLRDGYCTALERMGHCGHRCKPAPDTQAAQADTRVVFEHGDAGPCSACGDGDASQRYHRHGKPAPPAPEGSVRQDVPPERIWTHAGCGEYHLTPDDEGDVEYVLSSTAEGLAEALREMMRWMPSGFAPESKAKAMRQARAAGAKYEGKGRE